MGAAKMVNPEHLNKGLKYALARENTAEMSDRNLRNVTAEPATTRTQRRAANDELQERRNNRAKS